MKQPRCDAPAPFRILKPIFTTNTKPKFPPLVIAVAVASSALFNPLESSAQESSTTQHKLETLIVSATRLGQDYTETGSSVSVITSEDIRASGMIYALDVLASAPGVTINQNGSFGGNASVRIRGASSEQTMTLINGVPVNDPTSPGGGFNFARIDTENIERIEILKGPQSTLWGTDAIGGVVSITTKAPKEGFGGEVFGEYGSFNTFRGGASISGANEVGDFRLAAVNVSSDGISKADEDNGNREDDPYDSLTITARGGINLPGGARISADVLSTDAETEFDSFTFGAQGNVGDGDELSDTEELTANLVAEIPLFDGRLDNLVLLGYSDIERENFTDGVSSFAAEGERVVYRYQGTLAVNDRNRLAFGLEREDLEANDDDTTIDGQFLLFETRAVDQLTLTAGLRRDDHDQFGSETTARFAGAWSISDALTARASWGEGFKAPTLFQTTFFCCGAEAPNADLEAETSEAFDAGLDWSAPDGRMTISATIFQQDTENMIDFDFGIGGYLNIDEVESTGFELSGTFALYEGLSLSVDYAYIDAEDGDGNTLVRLPENTGDLTLSYDFGGAFSGSLLVRYNDSEENTDGTELDSWTRVDLSGRYAWSDSLELYGRIENLFDEDYQQILGYGTPGLSGSLGVRVRY
ncbi:MAG: TonB-dependent receptor [Pseudomonadota bacterium]